jgi:hypothetical protein
MTLRKRLVSSITVGVFAVFSSIAFAQQPQEKPAQKGQGERQRSEGSTLTGCLSKGSAADEYILTDSKTGTKIAVTADSGVPLEKHSANHTVRLTGSKAGGTFTATKVEHVSATCEAAK